MTDTDRRYVDAHPLLAAALDYAGRGWPVLPLRPRDKMPNGLLVAHGLSQATTDVEQILEWWRRVPSSNVGIRTGAGLDVVDLDGDIARRAFAAACLEPVTPGMLVRTARGWHLWFASSGLPTRASVIEGVDVRGKGGYVVAPPSVHPSGATYRLVDPASGRVLDRLPPEPLAPAPAWLVSWCRPGPTRPPVDREPVRLSSEHYAWAAVQSECAAVAATGEGSRNDRLNRAAFSLGTLVGARVLEVEEARANLLNAALLAGLGETEALRTIASGLEAGESRPRQVTGALRRADRPPQPSRRRVPDRSVPGESRDGADDRVTAGVLARARHGVAPRSDAASPTAPRSPLRELGR